MSASPRSSFPPIPQHHHVSLRTETVGPERRHPRSWEQQIFQWNNAEDFDKDIFHLDQISDCLADPSRADAAKNAQNKYGLVQRLVV